MSCCTSPLSDVFTEEVSRKDADRYRKHGLPKRARKLLRAIEAIKPFDNTSTLEIGVGAGAVTTEMLRRGVRHAIGVDAVPAQLANARALAADYSVADRAEYVLADFAESRDAPSADVVIMDRVICCYPRWRELLENAADHANETIAMTYPRDKWWFRIIHRLMDLWWIVQRSDFRFHVHPIPQMHAALEAKGFAPRVISNYFFWEILVATRSAR
jgi:spermidine synthase